MDIWSIAGNIVATIIVSVAVFLFGRWRGWWGRASRPGKVWAGAGAFLFLAVALAGAYIATRKPPPERATTPFAILVADLDGDADRGQTRHILQSLRTQFGKAVARGDIEILSRGEALAISAGNMRTAEEAVEKKGRAWLKEQNASVLIWGEAAARDTLFRLRFLAAEGEGGAVKHWPNSSSPSPPVSSLWRSTRQVASPMRRAHSFGMHMQSASSALVRSVAIMPGLKPPFAFTARFSASRRATRSRWPIRRKAAPR
jgi:hypothetical protein